MTTYDINTLANLFDDGLCSIMPLSRTTLYLVRLITFLMALLTASSLVGWGLKLSQSSSTQTLGPVVTFPVTQPHALGTGAVSLAVFLDGVSVPTGVVTAVQAPAASRYKVLGVVSNGRDAGYAIITVDGKAAKPYGVGALLDDGTTVVAVSGVGVEVQHNSGERVLLTVQVVPSVGSSLK